MTDSTELRSEGVIKGKMWSQGNSSRWQVQVVPCSSGFLATLQEEEIIKRGVETTNKHVWKNSGTYPGIAKKGSPGGKISNTRA